LRREMSPKTLFATTSMPRLSCFYNFC